MNTVMNILLRKYIVPLSAAVMLPFSAAAQDLNPTVEVSREYRGTLMDLDKPSVDMALPDSVLRFNLQFDYSVFDSPFKGAYEFRPFLMDMDIAPGYSGERKFYLRAGAGYSLHPELDLVWSPVRNDMFRLSLYARHRSYVGNYRALGLDMSSDEAAIRPTGARFSGHDLLTEAGVAGSLDSWISGPGIMARRSGTPLSQGGMTVLNWTSALHPSTGWRIISYMMSMRATGMRRTSSHIPVPGAIS